MSPPSPENTVGGTQEAEDIRQPSKRLWGLSLGFSLTGVAVIASAALSLLVIEIPISAELGLLQLLPPLYWLGLGLMGLGVALALRSKSPVLIVIAGVAFFALFAGTPILFEPLPRYWDSYVHLAGAQQIGLTGHLSTAPLAYPTNWPGFFILVQVISTVGAVDPIHLLAAFPFLTGGLTFLALFVFLRFLMPPGLAGVAAVLGSLINVWAQFHLSPQSMGLVLAFLVLATVWRRSVGLRTVSAVLFVGLVVSHPTSAILLIAIFVVDALITGLKRVRSPARVERTRLAKRFAYTPALPFAAVWIGWLFFRARGTSAFAQTTILSAMGDILRIPEETLSVTTARTVENLFTWAPLIRLGSLLIIAILVAIALYLIVSKTSFRRQGQFFIAALIALAVLALVDILAVEAFYDRVLMLFAAIAPAIILTGLQVRKVSASLLRGVIALLVVASIAAASTTYYQESFNFVSERSASVSLILERADPGASVLDGYFPVAVWLEPGERTPFGTTSFFDIYPDSFLTVGGNFTVYAVFDGTAVLWYRQWLGIDVLEFYEADRSNFSLIYTNGDADVHLIHQPDR